MKESAQALGEDRLGAKNHGAGHFAWESVRKKNQMRGEFSCELSLVIDSCAIVLDEEPEVFMAELALTPSAGQRAVQATAQSTEAKINGKVWKP